MATVHAEEITKRVAVERALRAGESGPSAGIVWIKENLGMDVRRELFTYYKSQIGKNGFTDGGGSKKAGRPSNASRNGHAPGSNGVLRTHVQPEKAAPEADDSAKSNDSSKILLKFLADSQELRRIRQRMKELTEEYGDAVIEAMSSMFTAEATS